MKSRRSSRLVLGRSSRRTTTLGAVALAAGTLLSPAAFAATQTLNVSGNWDTTTAAWDAGAVWVNGNDAVFGGTASAIEIAGSIQVAGISSANDVVFNNAVPGGSLTFVSPATLSGGGDLTFNVVLAGSAGLTVDNAGGVVTLNADNSLTGPVAVTAGSLVLGSESALNAINGLTIGAAGSVTTSAVNQIGFVTVTNAGTLTLGGNDTVQAYVSNGGTVGGTGTLTAATYALNDGSTVNNNLGNGVITANGSVALNGNTGSTGALAVQSGTTTVAGNLGASVITVSNGATLATSGAGNLVNTAAVTLNGTGALQLGSSDTIGNLAGAGQVDLGVHTLTLSNGAGANSAAIISGTGGLTLLAGTQTLSGDSTYLGATNVNGGTLALTGTLASTVVNVASGAALTSTGGLADTTQLILGGTGTATFTGNETLAGLTGGTGAVNATGVDLTITGTLETLGNISVRDLTVGTLNGASTINSTGTVTASAGTFGGNIASGSLVKDGAGTLTLTATQGFTGGTDVTAGTLVLGHATNTLADSGALTLQAGATVDLQGNSDTVATFTANGGTLAGTGTLTAANYNLNNGAVIDANLGAGTITANGAVALNGDSAAATLNVQSGVTTLAGASAATDVNVTGGSLDLAPTGSLALVETLDISAGATVLTSVSEQLSDTAAVTNNGTLSIGGDETVGSLQNSGTIAGAGTLTTAVYNLNAGSNITGNLGEGVLNVTGNTGISGTAGADTVNVTAGTLTLTGNNLDDSAAVTNSAGATITLTGDDTVGTLVNSGTIAGTGVLTAATYELNEGSVISGHLGTGTVEILGATNISGTVAAETVNVAAGITLTLSGDNLADTSTLDLGSGATITLLGDETVGTFINNAAFLAGFGTLNASNYVLNDGTVIDANLGNGNITTNGTVAINGITGTGVFTVASGQTTLATFTGANTVNVSAGADLVLTADAEINVATTIDIGTGASLTTGGVSQIGNATLTNAGTLTLGGNDTIAAYVSNGGLLDGPGKLTAASYALNDGSVVNSNLGDGDITANGTVAINGTSGAGAFVVESGETTLNNTSGATSVAVTGGALTLTAAASLNDAATISVSTGGSLTVGASDQLSDTAALTNAGTLDLGAHSDTVATFVSDGGHLAGTGTLTAASYALNDGTVIDAKLGDGDITANGVVAINGTSGAGALVVQSGETTLNNTSGATSVAVTGGALTLTVDASLLDATTINLSAGTALTTGAADQLADNAAVTSAGAITLGGDETILTLAGSGSVDLGEFTLTLVDGGGASTSAVISGTGGLTLLAGTQTLSDASTYTGDTTVESGTLNLNGDNASDRLVVNAGALNLNANSAATTVDIASGAVFTTGASERLNNNVVITNDGTLTLGGEETLGALFGGGTVNLGSFNLVFAGDGDTNPGELISEFSGAIIGSGTLTKNGDDIQVLSGTSTYSGIAFINDGVLRITNANALGDSGANGRTNVNPGGTLQVAGGISLIESIRISGVGFEGQGAINNFGGVNTLTGQIGIVGGQADTIISADAGTLNITGDILRSVYIVGDPTAAVARLTFHAAEDASIVLTGSNALFYLSNIGDIAKTGAGTLDLVGLIGNQSTGNLLIEEGTVRIGLEARLGGSQVVFGESGAGVLSIASTATQTAIAPAGGQIVTGGDGTYADFRNTIFDFAAGDGTIFTEADTAVRLSNLHNFADARIIKDGAADLLLDLLGGGDAKILPSLVVNSGSVFFLAEETASLTLAGLGEGGAGGGTVVFGALDLVINQDFSSTFTGNLDGTGNLTINTNDSAEFVISGVLSNFASVSVGGDGTGSLELSGDNTYVGPTHVLAGGNLGLSGTLQTASVDVAEDGVLTLLGSDRLLDTATLANSGTIDLGANTETVASYVSDGGVLDGTGTLTAATYALNNGTTVNANLGDGDVTVNGDVVLNGSTGSGVFTVQTGGTLRGVGANIGGDLVIDLGATLAPGASPGITVVGGNWIHNGTFEAELAGLGGAGAPDGHDQVQVAGSIVLDNGTPGDTADDTATLAIRRDNTFGFSEPALGDTFRIINGAIGDQMFAFVDTDFSTGLVLDLADGTLIGTGLAGVGPSGRVDLTTLPGLDANTQAIVASIQADAFAADNTGGAVRDNGVQFNSVSGSAAVSGAAIRALLTSPLGANNNINMLSPESFAGEPAYAIRATRHYADTALAAAPVAIVGDFSIFTAYSAHNAGTTSSVNAADYDLSGSGALLGGRLHLGEKSAIGVFAAFDSGEIDSTHRNADVDGTVFGVFAETSLGERWKLNLAATLGDYDSDSTRSSLVGADATANLGVKAVGFSAGLSYEMFKDERRGFSPYLEFNYVSAESDAFTEAGPTDALAVNSIEHTSLRGELGARGYIMVTERFSFNGQFGVSQEFGDDDTRVTARVASGGTPFTVVSPGFGDTALTAGLGASYAVTPRLSLGAGVKIGMDSDSDTATSFHISGGMRF